MQEVEPEDIEQEGMIIDKDDVFFNYYSKEMTPEKIENLDPVICRALMDEKLIECQYDDDDDELNETFAYVRTFSETFSNCKLRAGYKVNLLNFLSLLVAHILHCNKMLRCVTKKFLSTRWERIFYQSCATNVL